MASDQLFLPPHNIKTQGNLTQIANWTDQNLMQINVKKSNYMVFTRSMTKFATRLNIKDNFIEQVRETKLCGVWITDNLKWEKNTREITRNAFARMSMITKLKYVGVSKEDLLDVYILFIRSLSEYCAVVWHSSLTVELTGMLERVQKICLKVILGDEYTDYNSALELTNLKTLYQRRENRCLKCAEKCLKHSVNKRLFPLNKNKHNLHTVSKEKFVVNFARGEELKKSAIPYLQRLLNC